MQVAVSDGLVGLAVMGALTGLAPRDSRLAVLAGMAGGALPDLDKPSIVSFGGSPWPRVVNRFHMRIQQHEAAHHLKYEVAAAAGCRRHRGRAPGRQAEGLVLPPPRRWVSSGQ